MNFNEHNNKIKNYIKKNLVDMDNMDLLNKKYKDNILKLIVNYTINPFCEIIINLNYNESLSKERKK